MTTFTRAEVTEILQGILDGINCLEEENMSKEQVLIETKLGISEFIRQANEAEEYTNNLILDQYRR